MSFDLSEKLRLAQRLPSFNMNTKFDMKFCDQLIEHMADGHTFDTFAVTAGVRLSTLKKWLERHQEFRQAKEIGELALQYWCEELVNSSAKGDHKAPAASIIFALKNYRPDDFKDKYEKEQNTNITMIMDTGIERLERSTGIDRSAIAGPNSGAICIEMDEGDYSVHSDSPEDLI